MATTEELLDTAIAHHQAGRLQQAEQLYRGILLVQPRHADALHLLGLVWFQLGQHDPAIASIRQAIALQPNSAVYWDNLAAVLHGAKRSGEAIDACQQSLWLSPQNAKAFFNLGCAYLALDECNLAVESFQRALQLQPDYVEAHNNLGKSLKQLGRWDEAIASYRQAVKIKPDFVESSNNLGAALLDSGQPQEAMVWFRRVLEFDSNYAVAYSNLGTAFSNQGQMHEAIQNLHKALGIDAGYAEAHMNLGLSLLLKGQFEEGWFQYEWRWKTGGKNFKPRSFSQPLWDGGPLEGRSILLHAEQGLGDTLQFIRYAALVQEKGGKVLVECPRPLLALLKSCPGIDSLAANVDDLPSFDVHAPLLSLPRLLGTNASNIPAPVPYLFAQDDLVQQWREKLDPCKAFKVGICWQGNPTFGGDRQRSFALAQFAPLAEIPGVQLISLQKGAGAEQLANVRFPVQTLGADFDESAGAFMDSAAMIMILDLVITSDTAVAHLAGALGVRGWLALPFVPDWRWLLEGEQSAWYPTLRLFRQQQAGDWSAVFQRMRQALSEELSSVQTSVPSAAQSASKQTGGVRRWIVPNAEYNVTNRTVNDDQEEKPMTVLDQFRLDGKRALITAGSRGLGFAMAKALAEAGADLVLVSQNIDNLNRARQQLEPVGRKIEVLVADLFQPVEVEKMCGRVLAEHGPIHILINNVGGRRENIPFLQQSLADWQRLMDLNLTSTFICTKMIGKPMVERRAGRVINIGSICGQIAVHGIEGRHYETAKAAIYGFTRTIAADWAGFGVTVNNIAPGGFMTDANRRWFRENPALQEKLEAQVPMGRLGEPDEIGPLAVYLASDASRYMTGATLYIDGGRTLW